MRKVNRVVLAVLVLSSVFSSPCLGDPISPRMGNEGRTYSTDNKPNTAFFGTGIAGRLAEASSLRFEAEQELLNGNIEEALRKSGKAVTFDPGNTDGHLLYARALTTKFYEKTGPIDEKLLDRCITEWKLIWRHDADQTEQWEARSQARKLMKIQKALLKQRELESKAKLAKSGKEAASKPSAERHEKELAAKDEGKEL